jgi:hypothetical protein
VVNLAADILYINPRKKRRRKRRRRRNPDAGLAFAANPRRSRGNRLTNIVTDVAIVTAGAIAGSKLPSKVFGVTGNTKMLVQAGLMLGTLTLGRKIVGAKNANRIGLGMGISLGITAANRFIFSKRGTRALEQESDQDVVLIPEKELAANEMIPEIEQPGEEIPEIELGDIEPETISQEDLEIIDPGTV